MAARALRPDHRRFEPGRLGGVPVFLYHGLTREEHRPKEWKYLVSESEFVQQLKAIRDGGYQTFLLRDIWNRSAGSGNGNPPPVILTFDDGLDSGYELVYPLLLEAGIRADFFINVSSVGQRGFLTWNRIQEMQRGGMWFQSHGYDHVDLSRLPLPELRQQLRNSKKRLEDRLGAPVEFLSAPSGLVNRRVLEVALEEGYRAVCNSRSWPARPGAATVNRVPVFGRTTLGDFRRLLARSAVPYAARATRSAALYLPKRVALRLRSNHVEARVSTELSSRSTRLHVFVLIDALGWHYIQDRRFLDDVLPYRKPLRTVLGYSSGAIPTILTGKPPAQHGHWNLFYLDPERSPFRWLRRLDFLPDRVLDNRISRKLLKEMGRHVLGLGPLFECCVPPRLLPLFDWVEKQNIYEPGAISGAPSIFDAIAEAGVRSHVYTYHEWTDKEILERARRDIEREKTGFFFLYLSQIDHFLHHHCEEAALIDRELASYESRLREVFAAARQADPEARLAVFSDHGMTPIRHRYNLSRDVAALGFSMPKDYLAVYDSTMARFWFYDPEARRRIVEHLESLECGRVLPDEELRELGVLFDDRRFGEVIFLLNPGWLMSGSDFNEGAWMPRGMHGYHPDDPWSSGVFLSSHRPQEPIEALDDVYQHLRDAFLPQARQSA